MSLDLLADVILIFFLVSCNLTTFTLIMQINKLNIKRRKMNRTHTKSFMQLN